MLEHKFDLPAHLIDRHDRGRGQDLGRQRGPDQHPFSEGQSPGLRLMAFFRGGRPRPTARFRGSGRRQAQGMQVTRELFVAPVCGTEAGKHGSVAVDAGQDRTPQSMEFPAGS